MANEAIQEMPGKPKKPQGTTLRFINLPRGGLYEEMLGRLSENLNKWKRVEGLEPEEFTRPANKDFYTHVCDADLMKRISDATGLVFPEWGSRCTDDHTDKGSGQPIPKYIGGLRPGETDYDVVGIRWCFGHDEWDRDRGTLRTTSGLPFKQAKMGTSQRSKSGGKVYVIKPQVICTLRPVEIAIDILAKKQTPYTSSIGSGSTSKCPNCGKILLTVCKCREDMPLKNNPEKTIGQLREEKAARADRFKPDWRKIMGLGGFKPHPLWEKAEIIPLGLNVPVSGMRTDINPSPDGGPVTGVRNRQFPLGPYHSSRQTEMVREEPISQRQQSMNDLLRDVLLGEKLA